MIKKTDFVNRADGYGECSGIFYAAEAAEIIGYVRGAGAAVGGSGNESVESPVATALDAVRA